MSFVATKAKFHIALDGVGLLLQGAPGSPGYKMTNAPVYGTRFASGDRDYNDLSQWWYLTQTDWSGGFKDSKSWEDDAKFYYSENVDVFSKKGAIRLMKLPTVDHNFTESIKCGVETSLSAGVLVSAWKLPTVTTNPDNFNGTTFASIGIGNWTNPTNAYSSNNSDTTAAQGGQKYQQYSNFGFSIPSNATIVGIESRIEGKCTQETGQSGTQIFAALMKDATSLDSSDTESGSRSHPAQPALLTASDVQYTRGGSSDLWGATLTPAEVNDVKFGVQIHGNRSSSPTTTNYAVDAIELRVYYRLGSSEQAKYIGTGNENGGSQPVIYRDDGAGGYDDISTSEFTNALRTAFVHLDSPFGILWAHTMTTGDNEANLVNTWDGGNWVDQSAFIAAATDVTITPHSSRCGASFGNTKYIFVDNLEEGYVLVSTTAVAPSASSDYTLVFENARSNEAPVAATEFEGSIYYLVAKGITSGTDYTQLELRRYDIVEEVDVFIKEFKNVVGKCDIGQNNLLINTGSSLVITVPDSEIWTLAGGILEQVFKLSQERRFFGTAFGITPGAAYPYLRYGGVIADNKIWFGNLIYDYVGGYFYHGFRNTANTYVNPGTLIAPLFTDATDDIYFISEDDLSILEKYDYDSTSFKTGVSNTASVIFSQHDKLQSIDKLANAITIGFEGFDVGEAISVYYSLEASPSNSILDWTLLGTASYAVDGSTRVFKTLPFPAGIVGKKPWFRINFTGDGTSSPELTDFTLEYLPMPDYKKQWAVHVNCGDEVKRLDGALVATVGRELRAMLETKWWTKSQLDFQDIDYATTQLDGSINETTTTITVDNHGTYDFPEQGRIRIDNEEILYTGKTPTTFTGCTRGARGTQAATHSDNSVVNNAYKVIITDIDERAPILNEDKNGEYIVGLSLREV